MDPDYNNAKRLLNPVDSTFFRTTTYPNSDRFILHRSWPMVEREHRQECIDYLNSMDELVNPDSVTGPTNGTFRHVMADYDESEGAPRIVQLLESTGNEVVIFPFVVSHTQRDVYFYKRFMAPEQAAFDAVSSNYYFDDAGHYYYSTDGENYTETNGEEVDETALPEGVANLNTSTTGRMGSPQVSFNPETNISNVHVRLQFSLGTALPDDWNNGSYVIQHGEPREITRLVFNVIADELPENLDLVGGYEDIPLEDGTEEDNQFGTHGVLSARRMVRRTTRNEHLTPDGRFSYDIVELELTAPIADNDAWFPAGEAYRVKTEDNRLSTYRIQDLTQAIDKIYSVVNPKWCLETTKRYRKFFLDEPQDADVTAAQASADTDPAYAAPTNGLGPETVYAKGGSGRRHFIEKVVTTRSAWKTWSDGGVFSLTGASKISADL